MAAQRPSEYNRSRTTAAGRPEWPRLELVGLPEEGKIDVYFVDAKRDATGSPAAIEERMEARILSITEDVLTMWPINTRQDKKDFLLPKYGSLISIAVMRPVAYPYALPETEWGVQDLLAGLPEGFAKRFEFGLGLHWEYRFICEAIAEHPGITDLVIQGGNATDDAYADTPFFMLGLRRFQELRKELYRIGARYQREALIDHRAAAARSEHRSEPGYCPNRTVRFSFCDPAA